MDYYIPLLFHNMRFVPASIHQVIVTIVFVFLDFKKKKKRNLGGKIGFTTGQDLPTQNLTRIKESCLCPKIQPKQINHKRIAGEQPYWLILGNVNKFHQIAMIKDRTISSITKSTSLFNGRNNICCIRLHKSNLQSTRSSKLKPFP